MALLLLEKLKKDINILFGHVRCLMAKSDENCPLVATEWSSNHSTVTGNSYTAGTYVFLNGHVYKCLFDNNGIHPTNTTYWLDLGEGHLLAEEQSDWNATEGRRFILNKPTKTSDFINDGEDGNSPYVTQEELNNSLPVQDLDSVLAEGNQAPTKEAYIKEIGFWDNFKSPFGYAKIYAHKAKIWFESKLGNTMFSIGEEGWSFIRNYTYDFKFPSLTNNRVATWQNKSGVVAFLSDVLKNHSGLNLDDGTNPHGTTKGDVGLGNVDNTSDLNKPISTATQLALDGKQNLLSSFDESILIEADGNIEGNLSLFEEYFEQQECELNFTPIQIIGVYLNGVKQKQSLYTIIPPKTISVTNFITNDYIEIQYTHLKS